MESAIQGFGFQNLAQEIRNPTKAENPESSPTDKESGVHSMESRIQTVLGYLTPGDTKPGQQLEVTFIKHYSSIPISFYSI